MAGLTVCEIEFDRGSPSTSLLGGLPVPFVGQKEFYCREQERAEAAPIPVRSLQRLLLQELNKEALCQVLSAADIMPSPSNEAVDRKPVGLTKGLEGCLRARAECLLGPPGSGSSGLSRTGDASSAGFPGLEDLEPRLSFGSGKPLVIAIEYKGDPKMGQFFPPDVNSRIRLDEIEWGGVRVNGIPPLDMPEYIPASEAGYLKDSNLVFGVSLNGESRAYPKRILAWHELARDRLGGVEFTFVYCTLCGSAIPYQSEVGGRVYKFGTSGLLFRSNKLMFDEQTKSLWSSIEGSPVVGPLADTGVPPVSWTPNPLGEWRIRCQEQDELIHPSFASR